MWDKRDQLLSLTHAPLGSAGCGWRLAPLLPRMKVIDPCAGSGVCPQAEQGSHAGLGAGEAPWGGGREVPPEADTEHHPAWPLRLCCHPQTS